MFYPLLILMISSLFNLSLGILVLWKSKNRLAGRIFSFAIFFIIIWSITNFVFDSVSHVEILLPWCKISYTAALGIVVSFFFFSWFFPQKKEISFFKLLITLLPFLFSFILIWFNGILGVSIEEGLKKVEYSPYFKIVILSILYYFFHALFILIGKYRKAQGLEKRQLEYLFLGWFLFIGAASLTNMILPLFIKNNEIGMVGPLFSVVMVGFTSAAIIRYRLLDIRFIIQRSLFYLFTLILIMGIYLSLVSLLEKLFRGMGFIPTLSGTVTAFMGILIFPYLQRYFQKITDKIFFKYPYNYPKILEELSKTLDSALDFNLLLFSLEKIFNTALKINKFLLLVFEGRGITMNHIAGFNRSALEYSSVYFLLSNFFRKNKNIIFYQKPFYFVKNNILNNLLKAEEFKEIEKFLEKYEIGLIAPVFSKKINAFLILGRKLSGDSFFPPDINLLSAFSYQLAVVLENIKLYEDLKKYTQTLEEKVKQRTKKLKDLNQAQGRFLTDVAHELQTPLAVIKGNLELINSSQFSLIKKINEAISRLSRFMDDLLTLAKADFGQLRLNKEFFSLNDFLKEIYEETLIFAEDKGLLFSLESKDQIFLKGDKHQLKGIFLNLISNGIKHTLPGGKLGIKIFKEDSWAKIIVWDTGQGINPKDLPHLFERFYRARAAGTGLGLAICRETIKAHQGEIKAESEVNKGSRFIVKLPLYKSCF